MAPPKPHPSMLARALAATGAAADQGVLISDTSFDMQMANADYVRDIGAT